MGLFDQFSKRNEGNPLSEMSVAEIFCDIEEYTEEFTNALDSSYKDFLTTVADSIIDCKNPKTLYGILDVAKKVEAETIADKDPESQERLGKYKEIVTSSSKEDASKKKIEALNEYQRSLLSEVYEKYCLPQIRQHIAQELLAAVDIFDSMWFLQKMDAVAFRLCEDLEAYRMYKCPDRYANEICAEMDLVEEYGVNNFYYPVHYIDRKSEARYDRQQHNIDMLNPAGLAAISKELGITDQKALRNALINQYIENDPTTLAEIAERVIDGWYPSLSLKELKDIVPTVKDMSNKEFCSFICNTNMDRGFYETWKTGYIFPNGCSLFKQADLMLNDASYNEVRRNAWKELGVSLDETVATMVLVNGEKYVDTYFEKANEDMDHMHEDSVQKPSVFKRFFAKNMNAMSVDAFRQNYSGLVSAINEVVKSDPAKYEPMLAAMKEKAMDKIKDVYEKQGLKDYLKNKDPWNSLHPTSLSTIVNDDTYIAYEGDKKNTPTFYVFGTVDQKLLKDVNEVISDRLKTKGAPEGKEYHIVISDGKAEDSAYKANLGNPKSLSAITPSDENKETRQWIQPIVKYKVDNGYEKYPSKPKTQERESTRREKSLQRDSRSR